MIEDKIVDSTTECSAEIFKGLFGFAPKESSVSQDGFWAWSVGKDGIKRVVIKKQSDWDPEGIEEGPAVYIYAEFLGGTTLTRTGNIAKTPQKAICHHVNIAVWQAIAILKGQIIAKQ